MEIKKVKISELRSSPVREEPLPEGFIAKVQRYKEVLKEVETHSLEEIINGFQRDAHPENELLVWQKIAEHYEASIKEHPEWGLLEKKALFRGLLGASLGVQGDELLCKVL